MKNTNSSTTYNDAPVMIDLTDEDLTQVTAGNGFNDSSDGGHRRDHRRDYRRDHRRYRRGHRR